MKVTDFETVKRLVTIRNKLLVALTEVTAMEEDYERRGPDSGGVGEDFEMGYECHVARHVDGSGASINLSGCYVGEQMADAARGVIKTQLTKVEAALEMFGVEVPEDS